MTTLGMSFKTVRQYNRVANDIRNFTNDIYDYNESYGGDDHRYDSHATIKLTTKPHKTQSATTQGSHLRTSSSSSSTSTSTSTGRRHTKQRMSYFEQLRSYQYPLRMEARPFEEILMPNPSISTDIDVHLINPPSAPMFQSKTQPFGSSQAQFQSYGHQTYGYQPFYPQDSSQIDDPSFFNS